MDHPHTLIFYDGHCGLCHRAVLFALRHDGDGSRFRYAPLQGVTFASEISSREDIAIADSIVVLGTDGSCLQYSDAVILMLREIGGGWRGFGHVLALVPRFLRDLVYRGVAGTRHLLFRQPSDLCPRVPPTLGERFLP